jgi:hypothetical protein
MLLGILIEQRAFLPQASSDFQFEVYLDNIYVLLAFILLILALVYISVKAFGKKK